MVNAGKRLADIFGHGLKVDWSSFVRRELSFSPSLTRSFPWATLMREMPILEACTGG